MNLKKKLVLLSLQMILSGFVAEFVNKLLFRLAVSGRAAAYPTLFLLEKILCRAKQSFKDAEKSYIILLNHHTKRLLTT